MGLSVSEIPGHLKIRRRPSRLLHRFPDRQKAGCALLCICDHVAIPVSLGDDSDGVVGFICNVNPSEIVNREPDWRGKAGGRTGSVDETST